MRNFVLYDVMGFEYVYYCDNLNEAKENFIAENGNTGVLI